MGKRAGRTTGGGKGAYRTMKIAVLMDAPLRATLLSEKTMARLAEWGEVAVNETDKAEKETVKQIIAGADIAITSWGVPQLDKEILDCAPNLRFVAHAAGSVKGIVSDELYARGIRVVSSARILSYGVSETALGLTICACKNVFAFNEEIRNGGWVEDYSVITELFDITVGVVGCGFAGSHYIELLQAFGVNVLAYDPLLDEAAIAAMGAKKADLDTLLAESDVVCSVLRNWDALPGLIGGALYAGEKMAAFAVGEPLDDQTIVVHFEKGRPEYRGVYQAINFCFAKYAAKNFVFINREQDADEEGLRQAKESYMPSGYLKKNTVRIIA